VIALYAAAALLLLAGLLAPHHDNHERWDARR